jgi:hypothetical protein
VLLGKVSVAWLSSTVEDLVCKAEVAEFFKPSREGSRALIVQRHSDRSGRVLGEAYRGGGCRGSIVVPEGQEGRGWSIFPAELGKAVAFFDNSHGCGSIGVVSRRSIGGSHATTSKALSLGGSFDLLTAVGAGGTVSGQPVGGS